MAGVDNKPLVHQQLLYYPILFNQDNFRGGLVWYKCNRIYILYDQR